MLLVDGTTLFVQPQVKIAFGEDGVGDASSFFRDGISSGNWERHKAPPGDEGS
jgi:hypothetical protein